MYCSLDDIKREIPEKAIAEATNDEESGGGINHTLVNSKIEEVSSYIDSCLGVVYPTPITNEDDIKLIRPICVSLVVCELYKRRLEWTDELQLRRQHALEDLTNLQKGNMVLKTELRVEPSRAGIQVSQRTQMFSDDVLRNYL